MVDAGVSAILELISRFQGDEVRSKVKKVFVEGLPDRFRLHCCESSSGVVPPSPEVPFRSTLLQSAWSEYQLNIPRATFARYADV